MKILNDFAIGLVYPKRYKELLKNKWWRVLIYIVVIIAIGSVSVLSASSQLKGILGEFYKESVPDFSFQNNTLSIAEPFEIDLGTIKIAADTSKSFTKEDMGNALSGYLFDSDSMILRYGNQTLEASYSQLNPENNISFTKASLEGYSFLADGFFALMNVMLILFSIAGFFFGSFIVALLSKLPNRQANLKFNELFKLALYSRGLPIILSFILSRFIGPLPTLLSLLISFMLVNTAISSIIQERYKKEEEI